MSLSRSPSPKRGGGWASPGLNANFAQSRSSTPVTSYSQNHSVTWASAQARSHQVNGYPAYQDAGSGFLSKHMRKISASLPFFNNTPKDERQAEKEKMNRARWAPARGGYFANFKSMLGHHMQRSKSRFILVLVLVLLIICFYTTRKSADTRGSNLSFLTRYSVTLLVQKEFMAGRRQQVCRYPGGQHGRRCHGVEGASRVGH